MTTLIVWMLIVSSDGPYNRGTVTKLAEFASAADCESVRKQIPAFAESVCVKARVVR